MLIHWITLVLRWRCTAARPSLPCSLWFCPVVFPLLSVSLVEQMLNDAQRFIQSQQNDFILKHQDKAGKWRVWFMLIFTVLYLRWKPLVRACDFGSFIITKFQMCSCVKPFVPIERKWLFKSLTFRSSVDTLGQRQRILNTWNILAVKI